MSCLVAVPTESRAQLIMPTMIHVQFKCEAANKVVALVMIKKEETLFPPVGTAVIVRPFPLLKSNVDLVVWEPVFTGSEIHLAPLFFNEVELDEQRLAALDNGWQLDL